MARDRVRRGEISGSAWGLLTWPVGTFGHWKAAGAAIGMHYIRLPRQSIPAGRQIVQVGIRTVMRAAHNDDIASVAELIEVVLNAPVLARLAYQVRPQFAAYDFVRPPTARDHGCAVEVDEHRFTHGIEGAVGATHADAGGLHQVGKGVGLIGDFPGVPDRCRITRGPDHDLGALIGTFARHLRKHAVVTDNQCQFAAARPVAYRNAQITWFPRFHRHPWVQLAVVQPDLAHIVDNQPAVVRVTVGVCLHDREAAPYLMLLTGLFERSHFRTIQGAHDVRRGIH